MTALPRSLNEPVGICDFELEQDRRTLPVAAHQRRSSLRRGLPAAARAAPAPRHSATARLLPPSIRPRDSPVPAREVEMAAALAPPARPVGGRDPPASGAYVARDGAGWDRHRCSPGPADHDSRPQSNRLATAGCLSLGIAAAFALDREDRIRAWRGGRPPALSDGEGLAKRRKAAGNQNPGRREWSDQVFDAMAARERRRRSSLPACWLRAGRERRSRSRSASAWP